MQTSLKKLKFLFLLLIVISGCKEKTQDAKIYCEEGASNESCILGRDIKVVGQFCFSENMPEKNRTGIASLDVHGPDFMGGQGSIGIMGLIYSGWTKRV